MTNSKIESNWQAKLIIGTGSNCECGITVDDHRLVVLSRGIDNKWHPTSHIPIQVLDKIKDMDYKALLTY